MKEFLKIALVQADLLWENPEANYRNFEDLLSGIKDCDLILLPEMFNTGFTMNVDLAEDMNGPSINWLIEKSKLLNSAICASLIINDNGFRNRMVFVNKDKIEYYDKRHLFSMANEDEHFSAGKEIKIVDYLGWKINLQICYDLRFPVFSRNRFQNGNWSYDLLIYLANWPSPRSNAWRSLSESRAIENQCYVAAVNRVGKDEMGHEYLGDSAVFSPKGEKLIDTKQRKESVLVCSVPSKPLHEFREKFPLGRDADSFTLHLK